MRAGPGRVAEIIREVARRILANETGKITIGTEAVRLTREGIPRRATGAPSRMASR
jgi:hypothetical protein